MKFIILSLSLFLFSCASTNPNSFETQKAKNDLTYWSSNDKVKVAERAINQWKAVGVKFARADESKSKLKIFFVPASKLANKEWLAQYTTNKILVNKDAKLSDKEYENVISHEIGHFFKLEHNNVKGSIMNVKEPLTTKVSPRDIKEAKSKLK